VIGPRVSGFTADLQIIVKRIKNYLTLFRLGFFELCMTGGGSVPSPLRISSKNDATN
jgi:hypothetical protein